MAWFYLLLAGLMEVGWAIGLKYTDGFTRFWPSLLTSVAMIASMIFLALALRTLPMGTAYAIWTGIGTIGTVAFGILLFNEPSDVLRLACIGLILAAIIGLKFVSGLSPRSEQCLDRSDMLGCGSKRVGREHAHRLGKRRHRHGPIDQTPGERLLGADLLAGHQDHLGARRTDERGQPPRIGGLRQETQFHDRVEELSALDGDPEIAGEHHAERAAGQGAVQCGDGKAGQRSDGARKAFPDRIRGQSGPRLVQIRPGREDLAPSGEHEGTRTLAPRGLGDLGKLGQHRAGERIRLLLTRDHD